MYVRKLSKTAFRDFVDVLIGLATTYGVQVKGDKYDFASLHSADDLRLDYDVTLLAPKRFFQPANEALLKFGMEGKYESRFDEEPFFLVGVHPYDMAAINQMDKIFSQDYYDEHYMNRRRNATIIVSDVITPSKNVFASSMNTATVKEGYDLLVTEVKDGYVVEAGTEKGSKLLEKADCKEASEQDMAGRRRLWQNNEEGLNKHVLKCGPSDLPKLLDKSYDHPVWEEKAKTCFGCGSCNIVCPTCYCFDIYDSFNWDLKSGVRKRVIDGCLLDGFTKVSGGYEFRSRRSDRFRHRLYRKGKYVPSKIGGEIACVGCGRCIDACLTDIANPVAVYNRLIEDSGNE